MDAPAPDPGERARLEALLFGRPGTASEADLAAARTRLAEFDAPAPQPDLQPEPTPDVPRSRRRPLLIVGAIVAAAGLVAAGVVVFRLIPATPEPSLAVFDRPQVESDRVPDSQHRAAPGETDSRLLLEGDGFSLFGFRNGTGVCLLVLTGGNVSDVHCTDEESFLREGLATGVKQGQADAEGYRPTMQYLWGPTGEPRVITGTATPPPPPLAVFDREQTPADLRAAERIPDLTEKQLATLRQVGDYLALDFFAYRPSKGEVCLVAVDLGSIVAGEDAACVTDAEFESAGVSTPTSLVSDSGQSLSVQWGPSRGLRVALS